MRITQSENETISKRRRTDDSPPPPPESDNGSSSSIPCCNLSFFAHQDIIDEIFLRLPLKSLFKFRCVSKHFYNLITSPSFAYKHVHQSISQPDNQFLLFSVYDYSRFRRLTRSYSCNFNDNNEPDVVVDMNFPFESAVIQFSCNGLLYLDLGSNRNCIWNPFTKEYRGLSRPNVLPPPSQEDSVWFINGFCGLGYDQTNNVYKILYFGCVAKETNNYLNDSGSRGITFVTEFNLYTMGEGSDTLRMINSDDNPYSSLGFGRWNKTGLFVNGALHWIMSSKDSVNCIAAKARIISFDIEKEEFGEIQKPQCLPEEDKYYYGDLQVLQGCLCICQSLDDSEDIDVWMLKDYAVVNSWTKTFTIAIKNSLLHIGSALKLLRLTRNGEIVIVMGAHALIVYDPINRKGRHVENIEAQKDYLVHKMIYVESLVSLNTGIYRGRRRA